MRLVLSLAATVLLLAGCAGSYDARSYEQSATSPACKQVAGMDNWVGMQVSARVESIRGEGGKLDRNRADMACAREEQNKTKPPQFYNFRQIGMLL